MLKKEKLCKKCNTKLPLTLEFFTPRKTDKSGFSLYCKNCINKEKQDKRLTKRKLSNKGGTLCEGEGRRCTICKTIYPGSNKYFGKHKNNIKGLDTYCKECRRNKNLGNYYKNPKAWNKTHKKNSDKKQQKIFDLKKQGKCIKCEEKRFYVLDYHHVYPSKKDFQISQGGAKGWDNLLKEIEKCVLLCSNCHREFHYLEKEKGITLTEYLAS